jgi:hypothetical protein
MKKSGILMIALSSLLALSACQSGSKTSKPSAGSGKSASLLAMETVTIAAHKCWFASKDSAFKSYRLANELNAFGGTPRFLLVPARNYGGLPLLVVQARGSSSKIESFGPLLSEPLGGRIRADLERWSNGNNSCASAA